MTASVIMLDDKLTGPQLDITHPDETVQIDIRADGRVVWVNVDGVCRLRVCRVAKIEINDARKGGTNAG